MKKQYRLLATLLILPLLLGNIPAKALAEEIRFKPGWKPGIHEDGHSKWPIPSRPAAPAEPAKPKDPPANAGSIPSADPSAGSVPSVPEVKITDDVLLTADADVQAAAEVEKQIADLPSVETVKLENVGMISAAETALAGLTPEQRALVKNADKITNLNSRLAAIVDGKITAIGASVKPESEAAIGEARAAYDSLSNAMKAKVTKLSSLTSAESALPVVKEIAALPESVTLDNRAQVKAARLAYDSLDVNIHPVVGNLSKLTAAEEGILALLPAAVVEQAPVAAEGLVYDGTTHALVTGGTVTGGTLVYSASAEGPYEETVPAPKTAGDHVLYYKARGDEDHKDSEPVMLTVNIQKKTITVDVTIADKQYNGKTDAAVASAVLNGVVTEDAVELQNGTAAFESAAVKENVPVTFTEFTLTGADAGNYELTQPTGVTGNIVNHFNPVAGTEYTLNPENTGWIGENLTVSAAAGFTLQTTNEANAEALTELVGSTEGENQTLTFYVKNGAGEISNAVTITYSLDKTAPTIQGVENGKTYYDPRNITVEDPTLKTAALDGNAAVITAGKAQIQVPAAAAKEEHVIAAEDQAGNRTEIRITVEPLSVLTGKTAHITQENLTRADKESLQAHIQEMKELKKSPTLSAADQAALDAAIARDQALIDRIDSGALEALAEIRFLSAYTKDTVTSADRTAIQGSLNRMDALLKRGTLPHEEKVQLTAARARAAELLAIIDSTAAMIEETSNTLESFVTDTVKSSNKRTIQDAMGKIDVLLAGNNLTQAERESLEALKVHGQELLQRIADAYNAVHTGPIERTEYVHKNNVHWGHREDLQTARDQLRHALKAYKGNYLDWEIKEIQKDLERIEAAIWSLDRAATAIWKIDQLPLVLQEGDNRTMAAIEGAKRYYDSLTVHEMYLVGMTRYNKLMDLYDSYVHYQVVPMYQEPESVDVVFQVTGSFKKFVELRIDDAALEKDKDYTVKACKEGTEIVLKDEYLKTLGTRRHEIEVDYKDGIAVGSITNRKVAGSWLPKTADGFHLAMWVGTLTVSMSALAVLMYLRKKKMNTI